MYGENYRRLPMKSRIEITDAGRMAEYQWKIGGRWCTLSAESAGIPAQPQSGSLEQFITEHYWGYSALRNGSCVEYHVSHVPWRVWPAVRAAFDGDCNALYGHELGAVLRRAADCAFIADGSPVIVYRGERAQ